jgi:triphosphoribosyl-dephospho-CoA synthase
MNVDDFIRSAEACASPIAASGHRVGDRILNAVHATMQAVATNTNLGIILLCAPLAAAAENGREDLRNALRLVLNDLDRIDAELAFRAIARAAPGGLGETSRHDVRRPAIITLREAMAEAADRDRIARQYVTDFADIFEIGLPVLERFLNRWPNQTWATTALYLEYLSAFPDTHLARKHGEAVAAQVQGIGQVWRRRVHFADDPGILLPELLAFDRHLKAFGGNPGTSADLTVATLFAFRLRSILLSSANNA